MLVYMSKEMPMLRPERITKLMERKGWDIGILAYQSGVNSNSIYKYLQGTRKVQSTLKNLVYLAKALGCSVEYLIGVTDLEAPEVIMRLSETQQDMIHEIGQLTPRRQRELAAMVGFFREMDAQDRAWIARNLASNEKLLGMINELGGEEAFFELLDSLGRPPTDDDGGVDDGGSGDSPEDEEDD